MGETGSESFSGGDGGMSLIRRVGTARRDGVGTCGVVRHDSTWCETALGLRRERAIKMSIGVGYILLLTPTHTCDAVRVTAECCKRWKLRCGRNTPLTLTETWFIQISLFMVVDKGSTRRSMVILGRHGVFSVLVVSSYLGSRILLNTSSVLGEHGGRSRTTVFVVSHTGSCTCSTSADTRFVVRCIVVVLLVVFRHLGTHSACSSTTVTFVGIEVVGDHSRVTLERVAIERVCFVWVFLVTVLLEEETDKTGEDDDTNKRTSDNTDDGSGGRSGGLGSGSWG